MFNTTQSNLNPYITAGQGQLNNLSNYYGDNIGSVNSAYNNAQAAIPGNMTQANLVNTPGYQFQLGQGLAATQASAASRGLGVSGAAMKGAAAYSTGLANSNYQQQFANQQTQDADANNQYQNASNRYNLGFNSLQNVASLGENAAATTGSLSNQAASTSGGYLTNAGNALAAGQTGVGNALSGGATNATNPYLQQQIIQQIQAGNTGSGGSGSWSGPGWTD